MKDERQSAMRSSPNSGRHSISFSNLELQLAKWSLAAGMVRLVPTRV
jgi:hypothetical protein